MASFQVTITVPDNQVVHILSAIQAMIPKLVGETNLQYLHRVVQTNLKDLAREALTKQAVIQAASSVSDPPITTS